MPPLVGRRWIGLFGDHLTTSTLLYVARLAAPQYLVEVDAWAVRQ